MDSNSDSIPADIKSLLDKASEIFEMAKSEIYPPNYPKVIGQKPQKYGSKAEFNIVKI